MDRGEVIMEKTLAIIKPDATERNLTGDIIKMIEMNNFKLKRINSVHMTVSIAEEFYAMHSEKPFFKSLVDYMTSGMVVVLELEKNNAIEDFRKLIGKTNPEDAEEGTIRKKFAIDKSHNSIHGSDSLESANREISILFG